MSKNALTERHDEATLQTDVALERNRLWWQSLPMTYAGWGAADRIPTTPEDFARVDQLFLDGNPWLKHDFDFGAHRGERALEIGCGCGSASCLLAKGGADVSAIDLTDQAVELAATNARIQGLDVTVQQMNAESLEFESESFDFVFSWGVIHHSPHTEAIVGQIHRVLKPGGRGMCMVYNRPSVRYYLYGFFWLIAKGKIFSGEKLATVQRFFTDGYYHRHFTPRELRALFEGAGLATERISITHMAKKMLPLTPAWLDAYLKRKFGWLLVIEFNKPRAGLSAP